MIIRPSAIIGTICLLSASGCATQAVFPLPAADSQLAINVRDERPPEQKHFRLPSLLNRDPPMHRFGDENFSPDRVQYLSKRFASAFPGKVSSSFLVVSEFEVHHHYPRIAGQSAAALFGAGALLLGNWEKATDFVVCQLRGTFDGRPFDAKTIVPYREDLNKAVLTAVDGAAQQAIAQIGRPK